jgi:hypothetical protein
MPRDAGHNRRHRHRPLPRHRHAPSLLNGAALRHARTAAMAITGVLLIVLRWENFD